jgi:hypothetical protein
MRIGQVALWASLVFLSMLAQVHSASAAVITQCGDSRGMVFYFEGGVIGADKAGWRKDVVPGGFELVANADNSEPDIIYENPALGPSSYRAEGAKVFVLPGGAEGSLLVFAVTKDRLDHYLFKLDGQGNGVVAWGTTGTNPLSQKSSLMTASCHAPL